MFSFSILHAWFEAFVLAVQLFLVDAFPLFSFSMLHTWFEAFVLAVQPFLVDAFPGVVQALLFVFFFDMPQVWFVFGVQPFLVGFGILARSLSSRCF